MYHWIVDCYKIHEMQSSTTTARENKNPDGQLAETILRRFPKDKGEYADWSILIKPEE